MPFWLKGYTRGGRINSPLLCTGEFIRRKPPQQWHRRRWLMKNASTEELLKLIEYPNEVVKVTAYGLKNLQIPLENLSIVDAESEYLKVNWSKKDVISQANYELKVENAQQVVSVFQLFDKLKASGENPLMDLSNKLYNLSLTLLFNRFYPLPFF